MRSASRATAPLIAWSRLGSIDRPAYPSGRRFVIVHLDGVSREALSHAMNTGYMPTLARWVASGERTVLPTLSGAPASTPAFQASLFYGERGDCPGYQWFDKGRGKDVRMDDAGEVRRLERSLEGRGAGLLEGGSTYFSLLEGGASEPAFSMSSLARGFPMGGHDDPEKNGWDRLASVVAHAVPFARGAAKMAHTAFAGSWDSLLWSIQKKTLRNEPRYMLNRLFVAELAEEVATYFTVLDISRGVPAIYSVYAGYDEVAHRRGPFAAEALSQLTFADHALGLIDHAIRSRPELRYELYILSDHGQEETRPIQDVLSGGSLADWVLAADRQGEVDRERLREVSWERVRRDRLATVLGPHLCAGKARGGGGDEGRPPIVVADAGDLAHLYFNENEAPLSLEEIEARFPAQLRAALTCPASGIVAARGGSQGFAYHRGKRFDLSQPGSLRGVLGYDPEVLRRNLIEMVATPSAGDLLVFGAGVQGRDVAYAWEFGSHGGVGAGDIETFFIHPSSVDASGLREKGPVALHHFFRERFLEAPGEAPHEKVSIG